MTNAVVLFIPIPGGGLAEETPMLDKYTKGTFNVNANLKTKFG
jgi:hypothetical protein